MEEKYAREFEDMASQPIYGSMYTKYLMELYTGILNEPELAEKLAEEELKNRLTAQTASWYA